MRTPIVSVLSVLWLLAGGAGAWGAESPAGGPSRLDRALDEMDATAAELRAGGAKRLPLPALQERALLLSFQADRVAELSAPWGALITPSMDLRSRTQSLVDSAMRGRRRQAARRAAALQGELRAFSTWSRLVTGEAAEAGPARATAPRPPPAACPPGRGLVP